MSKQVVNSPVIIKGIKVKELCQVFSVEVDGVEVLIQMSEDEIRLSPVDSEVYKFANENNSGTIRTWERVVKAMSAAIQVIKDRNGKNPEG